MEVCDRSTTDSSRGTCGLSGFRLIRSWVVLDAHANPPPGMPDKQAPIHRTPLVPVLLPRQPAAPTAHHRRPGLPAFSHLTAQPPARTTKPILSSPARLRGEVGLNT